MPPVRGTGCWRVRADQRCSEEHSQFHLNPFRGTIMNKLCKHISASARAVPLLAAAALTWPVSATAQGAKALEGTWEAIATIRDCTSGAAIRSVPRMITFAKGGTLSEYTAAGTATMPVSRAPGHGAWEYLGNASFSYSVKFMRLTSYGGPDGSISETRTLEVSPTGDSYSADGVSVITLGNGVQIPACATEAGTRLY